MELKFTKTNLHKYNEVLIFSKIIGGTMKFKLLLLLTLSFSILSSKIIEINNIDEIKPFLNKKYLIVFDLDNTIMEPVQELGTDQWFCYYFQECIKQGLQKKEALQRALREWSAIQGFTQVKLVETQIRDIINDLQTKNITTMGMTTRDLSLCMCTLDQLRALEINLNKSAPSKKEYYQNDDGSILFREGVLFTSGKHKGIALWNTLDNLSHKPNAIIFINDKRNNITPVEDECKRRGIEFLGFRYGYLDEKVANFNKHIANIQHKHFGKIISDEQAEKLVKN